MSYTPICDYALIGDCHGSALISRDGSMDWCCLGRFDGDPEAPRLYEGLLQCANDVGLYAEQMDLESAPFSATFLKR